MQNGIFLFVFIVLLIACQDQVTEKTSSSSTSNLTTKKQLAKTAIDSLSRKKVNSGMRMNKQAEKFAEKMAKKLSLNPEQKQKAIASRIVFLKERKTIQKKFKEKPEQKKQEMQKNIKAFKQQFSSILTNNQRTKWEQI